jgi:hypothetical protein
MITILTLLTLFGIKHFLCDFVWQYPYMIEQKGVYGMPGGIHHALYHAVGTMIVTAFVCATFLDIMILGLIDGVLHYHIDWLKHQLSRGLTTADRMFWVWFGADQCLHYLTYLLIIGLIVL